MIQRIQSLYLLANFLIGIYSVYLWDKCISEFSINCVLLILSCGLSFFTIFLFKNRKLQFVLNRVNIFLQLILLGLFIYAGLILSGESKISMKGIEIILPAISIVLFVLANKAIKRDEDLVKSVDRIR